MPRGLPAYNVVGVCGGMYLNYIVANNRVFTHGARRAGAPDTGRWTSQLRRHFQRLSHHLCPHTAKEPSSKPHVPFFRIGDGSGGGDGWW